MLLGKIKLFLFKYLEKILNFFSRMGISKKTPGALVIYNFLFKKLWPYKNIIEIQGSKMYVNVNDESFSMRKTFEIYASDLIHEKATTDLFKKIVKEGDTVVDLGANIGYFTLLAAKLVGPNGKVYSFEPEPKNYSYLKKNIELNNYSQATAINKAVSDKNGTTELFICLYDTGHHTINKYDGIEAYSHGRSTEKRPIKIETITLDEFFKGKEDSIDMIKMDVEGAEALALRGMDNILRTNDKLKMIIEFFPLLIKNMGSSPEELIYKLLNNYKFSIFVVPDDYDSSAEKLTRAESIDEIMSVCKREVDHINLFLTKNNEWN